MNYDLSDLRSNSSGDGTQLSESSISSAQTAVISDSTRKVVLKQVLNILIPTINTTMTKFSTLLVFSTIAIQAIAFPQYRPLGGLSERELEDILPRLNVVTPVPAPPGPPKDTSVKLVNDAAHPFIPLKNGDIRGPCPGLNTLASHGYLPRNGIVTPAQIINAVQDGFGMDNGLATLLA
ncbi:hypothetical protein M422DRAFT_247194 [Sphaerobolus stellatus SS14]|nr:hypothetical protein M422DRAFT_247194 [Sphaerobolus stellatus SS14]